MKKCTMKAIALIGAAAMAAAGTALPAAAACKTYKTVKTVSCGTTCNNSDILNILKKYGVDLNTNCNSNSSCAGSNCTQNNCTQTTVKIPSCIGGYNNQTVITPSYSGNNCNQTPVKIPSCIGGYNDQTVITPSCTGSNCNQTPVKIPSCIGGYNNQTVITPSCSGNNCNQTPVKIPSCIGGTQTPVITPSCPDGNCTVTKPDTGAAADEYTVSDYEQEVVRLINEIRAEYGLSELKPNTELSKVARVKAQDMKDNRYFSHTSPTYGSPFDMMKTFGISYRTAGENIAYGQRTPEEVVNAWMNSEGHRANILRASFKEIGMGYVSDGNYWVQMFIG